VRGKFVLIAAALWMVACGPAPLERPDSASLAQGVEDWADTRIASLTTPDGWLTLVGLHWLAEGENTLGAAANNSFVYDAPHAPPQIGTFTLTRDGEDATVHFEAAEGVEVTTEDGAPVRSVVMTPHEGDGPMVLQLASIHWHIIQRGQRMAVRLQDSESPVRTQFTGIDRFPTDDEWWLPARFEWHTPPDTIEIPNILGTINPTPSPGSVVFEYNGETHRIAMWKDSADPDNFFTAFADATNGGDTYGGGRFIWVDAPDEEGRTVIDFNRSYNPPCVFTEFATCPLPPAQNRLAFAVPAGEVNWKH